MYKYRNQRDSISFTSIRMDVATDRGLFDFIDGVDVKEKDTSLNTKVCDKEFN